MVIDSHPLDPPAGNDEGSACGCGAPLTFDEQRREWRHLATGGRCPRGTNRFGNLIILRDGDVIAVRVPTSEECAAFGVDRDVPTWLVTHSDGSVDRYPGTATLVSPGDR
jgi:hypothetical protein